MLFQDRPFEVNVKQVSAVNDPQIFASSSPFSGDFAFINL